MKLSLIVALGLSLIAGCYRGDPGYGLCAPDDSQCVERRKAPVLAATTKPIATLPINVGGGASTITGILPTINGGSGSAGGGQWWFAPVQASRWGTDAGDNGYPIGSVYRFDKAATITGVRYYCTSGGSQLFTVHAATSTAAGGAQTGLGTKACTQVAGVINTCSFDAPIAISDLTKVYTASVYGGSAIADCTFLFSNSPGQVAACPTATTSCVVGGSLWLQFNGSVYGAFNSAVSLPNNTDSNRIGAVEFVFTIP